MNIQQITQQIAAAGLRNRPSQLTMIEAAFQAFNQRQIICLEAPTGTGKTLAYGIAAYLAKTNQTIIISTATVTLQEQLYQKDLPLLSKILGAEIRAAIAKGRRRYVCHARLYDEDAQIDIFSHQDYQQQLRSLLENKQWHGDRDQLELPITDAQWATVSTDSAGCSGKLCTFYQDCAFYKARQKWQQTDFIITNHSLLLADLSLGGGALLPSIDKCMYVIDECHHLPDKALDFFAQSTPLLASVEWINHFTAALNKAVQQGSMQAAQQLRLQEYTHQLVQSLQNLEQFLQRNAHCFIEDTGKEPTWRCVEGQQEVLELARPIQHISAKLVQENQQLISEFEEKLKVAAPGSEEQQQWSKLISQFGFFFTRADNLFQTLQLFCQSRQTHEAPLARWFVQNQRGQYYCHAAPINISGQLKNLFWDQLSHGALLCSATLRAIGNFSDFRRKSGLSQHPQLTELALDTCFDYGRSILFVPKMRAAPQGGEQAQHLEETIALLPELILPIGGTLVLFTSKTAMEKTFASMPPALQTDILMQGSVGKSILLNTHQEKIAGNNRSVLFGLASFGEGLDLPADLCQHVIIHKLPFTVPTTPIELTRNEWLVQNQRNPFELSALPAAAIRLAQYTGRLIRQETDIGIVTVLDKRLYSKPYGAKLLQGLPRFKQLLNCTTDTLKATAEVMHLFSNLYVSYPT